MSTGSRPASVFWDLEEINHRGLVDCDVYWNGIVARSKQEVGEGSIADERAGDVHVQGHVTHGEGDGGTVRNEDRPLRIAAVWKGLFEKMKGGSVHAFKPIEP